MKLRLSPETNQLLLGRHRQNWEPIKLLPCKTPTDEWIKLAVRVHGHALTVVVNDRVLLEYEDTEHPLDAGKIGLRTWQREAKFRNLHIRSDGPDRRVPFVATPSDNDAVSGMWRPFVATTRMAG